LVLVLLLIAVAAGAYIGPMYAHYELRPHRYFLASVRFALARPASTVLVLLVLAAFAFASMAMPVLLFTVSIGAWLHTSTWLAVRFFEENERRLADTSPAPSPLASLPKQPLRIR
jgi:uncharacterized membrane protein YesL